MQTTAEAVQGSPSPEHPQHRQPDDPVSSTPPDAAGRPIIRRSSGSGLLARRRSRSRGTSASSVTFDLALEIPHESCLQQSGYFSQSSSTIHVHGIEQDSQLIVRECFRQALIPRLSAEQLAQIEEVLDAGQSVDATAEIGGRRQESVAIATAMTAMTVELRATRHGLAVIRRAARVNLESLNRVEFESHMAVLVSAHRSGNSRARVGSILLFCTELALLSVHSSDRLGFCQVLNWSLDFFRKTVSAWVVRAGGWDKVAHEPTKLVATVAFVLSMLLLGRAILRLIRGR